MLANIIEGRNYLWTTKAANRLNSEVAAVQEGRVEAVKIDDY